MDAREILKGYLQKRDEENGTDIASKINFNSTTPAPTVAPEAPAAPVAPEAPAAPAPVAEEKEDPPFDGPYKKPGDNKDQFGNVVKNPARHAAKKGMAAAIAKAKKAGATAETMVNFGSGEMSLGEAITKAGMDIEEFFEGAGKQNEVVEFVKSMYDETTGRFPKGETGVMIAVEKEFGEDAARIAHGVISELSQIYESKRLRQLAGVGEGAKWRDPEYKDKLYRQNDHGGKVPMGDKNTLADLISGSGDQLRYRTSNTDGRYGDITVASKGKRKGMLTKNTIADLKGDIESSKGKHHEPNLPESSELAAMLKIAGLK
jgi:hypothetical protein